ncbi:hypothetical protein E2562_009011 [Oryza meyeriana var. granulata]|uniref:Uncharacterized protein n=1 Tax=Oryza meyeriana var. granulata TaxID=110450 RepID=A0A6G1D0U8_9ORYZ|nr:hypothetical protein E2562_009011 [Oryza meyeriana var. granulata]
MGIRASDHVKPAGASGAVNAGSSLSVIKKPAPYVTADHCLCRISQTHDSGLVLATFPKFKIQLWVRKVETDGVTRWAPGKTVKLVELLPVSSSIERLRRLQAQVMRLSNILGYDEDSNVIHLWTNFGTFMIQLSEEGPNLIENKSM